MIPDLHIIRRVNGHTRINENMIPYRQATPPADADTYRGQGAIGCENIPKNCPSLQRKFDPANNVLSLSKPFGTRQPSLYGTYN
jgi:hypothetical protein